MFKKNAIWSTLAILLIATMLLGACQAAPAEEPVVEEPVETVEALPQGQELANAYAGMYSGKVVTMAGPFTDQDEVVFNDSIIPGMATNALALLLFLRCSGSALPPI